MSEINDILTRPQGQISGELIALINGAVAGANANKLIDIIIGVLHGTFSSIQIHKSTITYFASSILSLPGPVFEAVSISALNGFKQLASSVCDEADYILRNALFTYFINQEDFKIGAQYLAGINVDSTTKELADAERADIQIKCAEAFLEEDDSLEAEIFVNKAAGYMNSVTDWSLLLRYRVTSARVMDANRKFVDAAVRYYELSTTTLGQVNQNDLLELLGKSITCAVLGKASAQRSRILGLLVKDERLIRLQELTQYVAHAAVLTKMFGGQLLQPEELSGFEASLLPHQKAIAGDGFTIPQRAIMEHNLVAASKIYSNIYFSELATLLRLPVEKVEKVVARMIAEERLSGSIDQTENILYFEEENEDEIAAWNNSISILCDEVSSCVESIEQIPK